MKTAVLEKPTPAPGIDADRMRTLLLVRIACARHGLRKTILAADLAPFAAHRIAHSQWRQFLEQEVEALADAGLITATGAEVEASTAGIARASIYLGARSPQPCSWDEAHEVRLVAKALGLEREPNKRLQALATADGLRAAILQHAFGLKIRGVCTPSRLRAGLAAVALERAFGNQIKTGLAGKLGLSAKAGRLLAGQLAKKPRDFGTDARLVAALAAEQAGTTRADLASLRLAVLRRYLDCTSPAAPRDQTPPKVAVARPRLVEKRPTPVVAEHGRPGLAGFAEEVRRQAAIRAEGWSGNRKAYISHVWQLVRDKRPEWELSEIEFKCMLIEAHRAGALGLAHADLKDRDNIAQVQESAVVYKNAVFHFVRVDG
jgi:hypothetical protein